MTEPVPESGAIEESGISPAYIRMQRSALFLSVAGTILATLFFGWRCGIGVAIGSAVAYINMRWLHRGTRMMVDRMLSAGNASKGALVLAFIGRLGFVMAMAYVIFVSSRPAFYGFLAALFSPIGGAICEAVYEALPHKNIARSQQ